MIGYVKDEVMGKILNIKNFALIICLLAATTTPIFDWAGKAKIMVVQKSIVVQDDNFYTYSNKNPENILNQVAVNPKEALFYRLFAKPF